MLVRNPALGAALATTLGSCAVALLRGHGNVVVGGSIREVVFRAVYTEINARLATEALRPWARAASLSSTRKRQRRRPETNRAQIGRPWDLWKARAAPREGANSLLAGNFFDFRTAAWSQLETPGVPRCFRSRRGDSPQPNRDFAPPAAGNLWCTASNSPGAPDNRSKTITIIYEGGTRCGNPIDWSAPIRALPGREPEKLAAVLRRCPG